MVGFQRWPQTARQSAHPQPGADPLPRLACEMVPQREMEAADGARGRALIQASDGSTEVPPQPWSLVHQRSGENVSGETSHSSPPPESPLLEFHSGSGEPVTSGVQCSESAPSQPLVPLTDRTNSWHGSWAFPMRPGHRALYAKGKCAEICTVPPCPRLQLGEPIAVLEPCQGVRDEEGQLCHRIWGIGHWGGCDSVHQADLPQHFRHHLSSHLQLRRQLENWTEDVWMWKLTDLQPLQASECVALHSGSAQVESMVKLPDQPAKVVSDPMARMASISDRGR